jgi:hypothetical protein
MAISIPVGPGSITSPQAALAAAVEVRFEVIAAQQRPTRFVRLGTWAIRALAALTRPGPVELHVRGFEVLGGKEGYKIDQWCSLGQPTCLFAAAPETLEASGNWKDGFGAGRLVGRHEVLNPPADVRFN